jgi:hypothetical protein
MKDYKTFLKLQEAAVNKQAEARREGYEGNTKERTSINPTSKQWSFARSKPAKPGKRQ